LLKGCEANACNSAAPMKDENRAVFAGVPEAAPRAKQLRLGAAKDTVTLDR